MPESIKPDRRREAGERTRARLLEATRTLLAEHGEEAVTLRDITNAADANVAAVHYHFGSLPALIRATVEQAVQAFIESQVDQLRALPDAPSPEQIAAVIGHGAITVGEPRTERSFLRIVARVLTDPPPEMVDWIRDAMTQLDAELLPRLRRALPGVPDDELQFRRECVVGIINFLVTGRMRIDLTHRSPDDVERLLVSVIAGALRGRR